MSEQPRIPVNQAFDPEERRAQQELDAYMDGRPYQDEKGNIHEPGNGKFINADKYFDGKRDAAAENSQTDYADVPTTQLARKLAEAEYNGDRTTATNIEDAMLDKVGDQEEREIENARKRGAERSDKDTDDILDHLTAIKETELQKRIEKSLTGEDGGDGTNPETGEAPAFSRVYYEPNDEGVSRIAIEVTKEGEEFSLSDLKGGRALLTTDDTTYFVHGNYVDDLMQVRNREDGENHGWEVNETDRLPKVTIGKPLTIHGKELEGDIKKIEVDLGEQHSETLNKSDDWKARGEDPFKQAEELLDEMLFEPDTEVLHDEKGEGNGSAGSSESGSRRTPLFAPGGFRERIRNAMLGAYTGMQARMAKAGEYFNDEERGDGRKAVAAVAGVMAVAGAAYAASRGISLGGHEEVAGNISMKPHHHEAAQQLAAGNGGTAAPNFHEAAPQPTGVGNGGTTAPHEVTLHAGENPWTVSEDRLQELGIQHPTNAQIQAYDQSMARLNPDVYHYFGDSSEEIPVGTELKLPR